jgi:hypothetical protein
VQDQEAPLTDPGDTGYVPTGVAGQPRLGGVLKPGRIVVVLVSSDLSWRYQGEELESPDCLHGRSLEGNRTPDNESLISSQLNNIDVNPSVRGKKEWEAGTCTGIVEESQTELGTDMRGPDDLLIRTTAAIANLQVGVCIENARICGERPRAADGFRTSS